MENYMELASLGECLTMFDQLMGTYTKKNEGFRTDTPGDRSNFHFKNTFRL